MAAADYVAVVQQLYVSYFGRPADYYGLDSFTKQLDTLKAPTDFEALNALVQADKAGTTALSKLVNSFNASAESAALYGTDNSTIGLSKFVAAIYTNVLGREADVEGLTFWVTEIAAGRLTRANAAMAITDGALANTTAQGLLDAKTVQNKLDVATNFTEALDTVPEINGYSGNTAAAQARDLLAQVKDTTNVAGFQANVEAAIVGIVTGSTPGQSVTLTTGIDTIVGGTGNDIFNGSWSTAAGKVLGGLDSIDGGTGNDTMNIDDTATGTGVSFSGGGATIKNVENVNIATTGTFGAAAGALSLSGITGATLTLKSQDTLAASHQVTVADSSAVDITVAAGTVRVNGGKSATISGSVGGATVNDSGAGAMTTVNLKTVSGASTLTGDALTNVTLGATTGAALHTVTVVNTTADHTLNLTANGAGYTGSTEHKVEVYDAAAKTLAVTTTAKSSVIVGDGVAANTILKSVTAAGAGNLKLDLDQARNTAVTSFDGSAATGNIALANVAATTVSIKTGAGNDSFTTAQTAKSAFATGAGNDTVTIGSALAAGTTIDLGAGNDALLFSAGSISNTSGTNVTVVDGGAGTDTLALALVGAANVGVFTNFEAFDVVGMSASTLDMDILAEKNTVTGISGSGAMVGAVTLTNVGAGVGFTALADMNAAPALTLTQKTAGALTVTLDADNADDTAAYDAEVAVVATNATSLKAVFDADSAFVNTAGSQNNNNIILTGSRATSLEIVSGGDNAINQLNYTSAANSSTTLDYLTSVTVTGDKDLTFVSVSQTAANKSGIATFDASALTGDLTINTLAMKNAGTIKLGSGTDTVTVDVTSGATTGIAEALSGFAKSTSATVATAIAAADHVKFSTSTWAAGAITGEVAQAVAVVSTAAATATYSVDTKGIVTFLGAGPTTLDGAIALAATAAGAASGSAVAFQYLNDSYIFVNGVDAAAAVAATDYVVKLVGVTGVTALIEDGATDALVVF